MKKALIIILTCTTGGAFAQTAPGELKTLVQQSFSHFTQIKAMETQQRIAADQTTLAKTSRLPEVSGTATYSHVYPVPKVQLPGSDFTFQPVPSENINAGIEARQLLLDFGKSGSQIRKSQAQAGLLGVQTAEAREELAYQVANVYLNITFLQDNIAVQDANIHLLEETETMVENKLKHGDAIDLDLINTRVKLESYRNKKVDFTNSLQKQLAALEYLTGEQLKDSVHSDFAWAIPPAEDFDHNAAMRTSLEKEKVAETGIDIAKAQYKPSLFLNAGTGFKNGYLPEITTPKFNYYAGVSLSVPIYNGKKLRTQEHMAATEAEIAKLHTQDVKESLKKEAAQQNADLSAGRERLQTAEVLLQQANRALTLAQSRYRNGVITYLDLQNAQTSLLEAQLSKIQYQYQLSLAGLELMHLSGQEFWKQ
ncbi:TolC family protein [uncultured Chitinophaga sp.]|uniref:TolC family protein n=1 Tax=uncultured Chitinophaga sp. TaxID=339340 RepID=UPI00260282BF|nr:TolC family protein [uncultured Chitinophaga sp.]